MNKKHCVTLAAAALFGAALVWQSSVSRLEAAPLAIGQPAPAWELKDLAGKTVKSSDFAGKVVVLNFWATWCPPCRAEIPDFIELQKDYKEKGVVFVGVSLDEGRSALKKVKRFAKARKLNYPLVMFDLKVVRDYGNIQSIPTTFVIDQKGRLRAARVGLTSRAQLESLLKGLI